MHAHFSRRYNYGKSINASAVFEPGQGASVYIQESCDDDILNCLSYDDGTITYEMGRYMCNEHRDDFGVMCYDGQFNSNRYFLMDELLI